MFDIFVFISIQRKTENTVNRRRDLFQHGRGSVLDNKNSFIILMRGNVLYSLKKKKRGIFRLSDTDVPVKRKNCQIKIADDKYITGRRRKNGLD